MAAGSLQQEEVPALFPSAASSFPPQGAGTSSCLRAPRSWMVTPWDFQGELIVLSGLQDVNPAGGCGSAPHHCPMAVLSGEMPPGLAHSIVPSEQGSFGSCLFSKWKISHSLKTSYLQNELEGSTPPLPQVPWALHHNWLRKGLSGPLSCHPWALPFWVRLQLMGRSTPSPACSFGGWLLPVLLLLAGDQNKPRWPPSIPGLGVSSAPLQLRWRLHPEVLQATG